MPAPSRSSFAFAVPTAASRWCLGTVAASTDAANRITRISGVTIDITDRKEAEQRQLLLAREVDHRAKNALAVVHAIVSLTRADNIAQFVAAVEGRVQALARAHSLLSESRWRGANISDIIEEELAPYRAPHFDRVRISGTSLSLEPSTAQALALALHELATNAAKYGALSQPSGRASGLLEPREAAGWSCSGSSAADPRRGRVEPGGFGLRVIKASVEGQLERKGRVRLATGRIAMRAVRPSCRRSRRFSRSTDGPAERPSRATVPCPSKSGHADAFSWSRTRPSSR